jgi:hypothetical protein
MGRSPLPKTTTPVVFLHAVSLDRRFSQPQTERLRPSELVRVAAALDLRGFGRNQKRGIVVGLALTVLPPNA